MIFRDRTDAAQKLAKKLEVMKIKDPAILAIPRGGVVTGDVIARELGAKLDIIVSRKVGAPYNPELAIGAVMHDGSFFPNTEIISALNVPQNFIDHEIAIQLHEIARRLDKFRGRKDYDLHDKSVIVVDDGIATGATMFVTVKWIKSQKPARVIVAIPIGPKETIEKLSKFAEVVVLDAPSFFNAVGEFYEIFDQVTDHQVMEIMRTYGYETRT